MSRDMFNYKQVKVPQELASIIPHMHDVEGYREELHTLTSQWDLLTILGQMEGTDSDMSGTQREFQSLTNDLLGHLGLETLKKTVQSLGSVAQVAVDILIRNLFERTADIGFLATDEDIRKFAALSQVQEVEQEQISAIIDRFQEYVAKYSVYHNIILMNTEGKVLVQLDQSSTVERSSDSLIQEALITDREFVEIYRHTDLIPHRDQSLIYAYRVTETNDTDSEPIGVLCLCFRFENEMSGIFEDLIAPDDWSIVSILDSDGRVIASSDPYQVPCGATMERVLKESYKIIRFAGRQYLAKTCATKGYQGFFGLGWQGHVMLPLEHAFESNQINRQSSQIDPCVLEAVMNDPQLFSQSLRDIPVKADTIQNDLDRTVWNGNVHQNTNQSKVLLWNISATGERTKKVFESSIGNLHQTVISAILDDVTFRAALSVDIMDRNLYERANDCRWWSLTSTFRALLGKKSITPEDEQTISAILKYINDLYTVYTNLFVFDTSGKVLAVSNPAETKLIGKSLKAEWVNRTLALKESQAYCVSNFEKTPLYNSRNTYIYGAAIASLENNSTVGGIGIVFDSEPQFEAMLTSSLPQDDKGAVLKDVFAVFCDREQRIISSSTDTLIVGEYLDIDADFFEVENGQGISKVVKYRETYYAVGSRTSSGYREYKTVDHYVNDVICLVFSPLASARISLEAERKTTEKPSIHFAESTQESALEVAILYIGERIYGFRTENVHKALTLDGLTPIPGSNKLLLGKILDDGRAIPVIDFGCLNDGQRSEIRENQQVVILKGKTERYGILIDGLGPIPSIPLEMIDFNSSLLDANDKFTEGVLLPFDDEENNQMIVLLDAVRLLEHLSENGTFKGKLLEFV
ncbi:MAG: chemotaxis protein CheW [Pontiellaceae bacterium]|nr:chemotaxis protein CheW [Pontiellaceae bacterium]